MLFALDIDIQGQLIPNVYTLVAQLIATFIIYLIYKKYLYQIVVKWLNKRADMMQEDLLIAQEQKQLAYQEVEKAKELYQNNVAVGKQLISNSEKQAYLEKQQILEQAKNEAQSMVSAAKIQIENERQQMLKDVNNEIVDVAMAVSNKLLAQEMDQTSQQQAIEAFVNELNQ